MEHKLVVVIYDELSVFHFAVDFVWFRFSPLGRRDTIFGFFVTRQRVLYINSVITRYS